jgi:hypothetical protein
MGKSKLEIVKETIEYYSADPKGRRAFVNGLCWYLTNDGRKCAVGRYIKEEKNSEFMSGDVYNICHVSPFNTEESNSTALDLLLVDDVHGHSVAFWKSIQIFHDKKEYWTETGLSEEGQKEANKLIEYYTRQENGTNKEKN